jgi:hypothetical protein
MTDNLSVSAWAIAQAQANRDRELLAQLQQRDARAASVVARVINLAIRPKRKRGKR